VSTEPALEYVTSKQNVKKVTRSFYTGLLNGLFWLLAGGTEIKDFFLGE
jgi:Mg/Co/Ni transporter MgtE